MSSSVTNGHEPESDAGVNPIIQLVDRALYSALDQGATEIRIDADVENVTIRYLVDSLLQPPVVTLTRAHHTAIISRVKLMGELDLGEHTMTQNGSFRVRYQRKIILFQITVYPAVYGEAAVLRISYSADSAHRA